MDPNVQNYYNTPELAQARQSATQTQQEASEYAAKSTALPDLLREALAKKFSTNNPLYAQRETALQNYMRESEAAPLTVTPEANQGRVFNPQEQAAMIAGRRGAALAPITSLNEMLGTAYGGLDNIIDAATRSYQALAGVKNAKAQAARQNLEDLLNMAQAQQGQSNYERDFAEKIRQFNIEEARKGKEDSGIADLLPLIELFTNQNQQGGEELDNFWEDVPETTQQVASQPKQPSLTERLSQNKGLVGMGLKAGKESGLFDKIGKYGLIGGLLR